MRRYVPKGAVQQACLLEPCIPFSAPRTNRRRLSPLKWAKTSAAAVSGAHLDAGAPTMLIMDGPERLVRARRQRDYASSSGKRSPDPEADTDALVPGGVPVAFGRADVPWNVAPGTAPEDTATAFSAGPRRTVRRCPIVTVVIAILHPLPNVTSHIVETEGIGLERSNGRGLPDPLTAATVAVGVVFADLLTQKYAVVMVARAAYSHSASESSRYSFPVIFESQAT